MVFLAAVVGALVALTGAEAADKQPSCGETITADTKLDSDLLDCPNNGLVIGADGVTVNLNGHVITGDGKEFSECPKGESCDVGVLSDRYDGVTVMNGTTRGFGVGVTMAGSDGSEILGITATKNVFFGAFFFKSSRGVVPETRSAATPLPRGRTRAVSVRADAGPPQLDRGQRGPRNPCLALDPRPEQEERVHE